MSISPFTLYYQHSLSGLVATYEDTGYPASNVLARIDGTSWKSTGTGTQYITFDAGSGNTISPDYFILSGHNLFTAGATIVLQYSTDSFAADSHDIFTAFAPTSNKSILKTFTTQAKRYWRLKITGCTVIPFISMCWWGAMTVLDYADSITPDAEANNAVVNVSDGGVVQGIHDRYIERQLEVGFNDADSTLWALVKAWRDAVGMGFFGVQWGDSALSSEVWMMRRRSKDFAAPLTQSGAYRNINLSLIGRKE